MAAAKSKKHSRKGGKRSIFCFLGGCFGISNKVSTDQYGDGKLVKHPSPGKTVTVNDQRYTTSSHEIVSLRKEIDDGLDGEGKGSHILALPAYEVTDSKTHDPTKQKIKKADESGRAPSSIKRVDKQRSFNWGNPINNKLSHSVSLPMPKRHEEIKSAATGGGQRGKNGKRITGAGGEFDSRVGALILITTLIVMLIWGKMWAIISTAAWFYFLPRLRARIDESYDIKHAINGTERIDLDSWEYKKKVVLQGLLERNQHV